MSKALHQRDQRLARRRVAADQQRVAAGIGDDLAAVRRHRAAAPSRGPRPRRSAADHDPAARRAVAAGQPRRAGGGRAPRGRCRRTAPAPRRSAPAAPAAPAAAAARDRRRGPQRRGAAHRRVDRVVDPQHRAEHLGHDLADVGVGEVERDVPARCPGAAGGRVTPWTGRLRPAHAAALSGAPTGPFTRGAAPDGRPTRGSASSTGGPARSQPASPISRRAQRASSGAPGAGWRSARRHPGSAPRAARGRRPNGAGPAAARRPRRGRWRPLRPASKLGRSTCAPPGRPGSPVRLDRLHRKPTIWAPSLHTTGFAPPAPAKIALRCRHAPVCRRAAAGLGHGRGGRRPAMGRRVEGTAGGPG